MNSQRTNYEVIKASFEKEGYTLLTKIYENNKQKLEYICKMGHKHRIDWVHWNSKKKYRCPYCAGNAKLNIEFIRAEFAKEGYRLLSKVYKGNHSKLDYICSIGHKHSISWADWNSKRKHRCPECNNTASPNIEFIRAEFAKEDYILLTTVYRNNYTKLKYICPRGHRHSVSWNSWKSKKRRCPFCNNNVSKWEKIVKNFLAGLNIDYIPNDRTQLLNPETSYNLELDIWLPDLNKAIECNGIYWHTKRQVVKNDKIKQQLCKDQGIDLLVITDKEWNDDINKCKNKIQEFLLMCST